MIIILPAATAVVDSLMLMVGWAMPCGHRGKPGIFSKPANLRIVDSSIPPAGKKGGLETSQRLTTEVSPASAKLDRSLAVRAVEWADPLNNTQSRSSITVPLFSVVVISRFWITQLEPPVSVSPQ